ncbi:MAG TPA: hypothetical protein DDY31_18935 [Lachnospiraceae bacterium]|nr:hypothetical protein [Lachnospiraceae bacterium]
MKILSRNLMEKLLKFQVLNPTLVYDGGFAGFTELDAYGCHNQCSGSCEGNCEGSCDSSCYGGCEGSFGYE